MANFLFNNFKKVKDMINKIHNSNRAKASALIQAQKGVVT